MPDIDFQKIELNLIPKKGDEPVIFYASQYESARPFIADLKWGTTEFAPGDDCYAEIDIRKNDNNLVVITDDVAIDNNEVSVILPVQALTCIGKNLGQVKIYAADDQLIAALNFILEVQPDPLAGGVDSETAIDNLTTQIEAIAEEVIGEDYYDKTEVDNALALKANSSDLATVATTGDYDDLINKPTIPAAQVQADYAQADNTQVDYIKNKPDINAMIAAAIFAILPVDTASGNPCTFDTEIAGPIQGLTADIVASGGGGTPIVGHSALNLVVNGETFTVAFGQTVYGGVYDANRRKVTCNDEKVALNTLTSSDITKIDAYPGLFFIKSTTIKTNWGMSINADTVCICDDGYVYSGTISGGNADAYNKGNNTMTLRYAEGDERLYIRNDSCATVADLLAALANANLVYPLITPIEIDVPTISPSAVVGTNTITSDGGGDVTVSYKDSIQHYIDNQ